MLKQHLLKKFWPDSFLTYGFMAFIAMTGLSYMNFMPGVVNALATGIGFSEAAAGQIIAMNGYGGILGSSVAILLIRSIRWQPAMFYALATLLVFEAGTAWIDSYDAMLIWRFLAGTLGGLSVGIAFSVLARLNNPDRAFGLLLFIQFSIGSVVMSLLPALESLLNAYAVFYIMASFVLLSLFFLPFLPPLSKEEVSQELSEKRENLSINCLLILLAIFFYQLAASAIWAYVGLIGLSAGIISDNVSFYIAITGLLGLAGAMLPVLRKKPAGRSYLISSGIILSAGAAVMLNYSQIASIYVLSMSLLFFSWPAVLSGLLAVTAELDISGRLSTIAAVVSSLGMASGPLLASVLLNKDDFSFMLYSCSAIFLTGLILIIKSVKARKESTRQITRLIHKTRTSFHPNTKTEY